MSFSQKVRDAQREAWPHVLESLDRHKASRRALQRGDIEPTTAARARATKPMDRVASEETVWTLAKLDMLASPAQAAVVRAARAWAAVELDPTYKMDPEERALYEAIQVLATDTN